LGLTFDALRPAVSLAVLEDRDVDGDLDNDSLAAVDRARLWSLTVKA